MPTKTLPLKYKDLVREYDHAGPMPNADMMKQKFWGLDAICVWCGVSLYNLGKAMTPEVDRIYNELAVS